MATQEKLRKSLEWLKKTTSSNQPVPSDNNKKKEKTRGKIQHCNFISEAILNPTIKVSKEFNLILNITIDVLLQLCDDSDSDVRMIADECLNKITRASDPGTIARIQLELFNAIKTNGPSSILRAALWRFALLVHHVRPSKGKAFVVNIVPALLKIFERDEELVHETLANSMVKIMHTLGPFTTDNDIKALLKACLGSIQSSAAVIRRNSASCMLTICLNSRKPFVSLAYIFKKIIELLVPVQETHTTQFILGALGCIKTFLPHMKSSEKEFKRKSVVGARNDQWSISVDKYLQIYELCLHYLSHSDHNIVNACLETLNVLLQEMPGELQEALLAQEGIGKSRIFMFQSMTNLPSCSQLSVATTVKSEEDLLLESAFAEMSKNDLELTMVDLNSIKDFDEDKDVDVNSTTDDMLARSLDDADYYSSLDIGELHDTLNSSTNNLFEDIDKLVISEKSSEMSFSQRADERSTIGDNEYMDLDVDVGHFTDSDVSLVYCARYIANQFLLNGVPKMTISDKIVRVSMKNLALSVLSTILRVFPDILILYLDKQAHKMNCNELPDVSNQEFVDLLLYANHSDPQIRGIVRMLVANYLKEALVQSHGQYEEWLVQHSQIKEFGPLDVKCLLDIILKGLQDKSSTCTRHTLTSLTVCLYDILESHYSTSLANMLNFLPVMAKDPYWLVKVRLLDVINGINYVTVEHVTGSPLFQNKVIYHILLELLNDGDQRVRNACANSIVRVIPFLYFRQDYSSEETTVTYRAVQYKNAYIKTHILNELEIGVEVKQKLASLPFPFNKSTSEPVSFIENSLSRILTALFRKLALKSSKYFLLGFFEALSLLAYKYPTTVYKKAWNCFRNTQLHWEKPSFERSNSVPLSLIEADLSSSLDLLNIIVHTITTSVSAYDMNFHTNAIKLSGNLFVGKWIENLKSSSKFMQEVPRDQWAMFTDKSLGDLSEQYLIHLMRLLNIFVHVIEDTSPVLPQTKLPNLPSASALSPIKRKKSDAADKKQASPGKTSDKDDKKDPRTNALGYFGANAHYMKVYDILRIAYRNYKITLEIEASENFISFFRAILSSLCQILEVATLTETERMAKEILLYLRTTFKLEPSATLECAQQLLKSIVSANLSANSDEIFKLCGKNKSTNKDENDYGFYYQMAHSPFKIVSEDIQKLNQSSKIEYEGDSIVMGFLHRKDKKISPGTEQILESYIRHFEPMVTTSLKYCTTTSDVKLQYELLKLLSQLTQLKVNYCLIDSQQVFINFVLAQFEFIEEGQIPLAAQLIPRIFQFLVYLSYGKQHTKSIIVIPKIIQLCDGLMASGQSPETHCIAALKPVVIDVFLLRNPSNTCDMKELETTREVLLSTMIRLLAYSDILDLLVLILNESKYCKDSDRWIRWSKQVFEVFLTELKNKIEIQHYECFQACKRLIFTLHPSVYKPMVGIVVSLFNQSLDGSDRMDRVLGRTNLLLLILTQISEEKLLRKITINQNDFNPNCIYENFIVEADPLNVSKTFDVFEGILPEVIMVKFFFRIISVTAEICHNFENADDNCELLEQFYTFLRFICYVFQSGHYQKLTETAMYLISEDALAINEEISVENTNNCFLKIRRTAPLLTFQWCYILALLNYSNDRFWMNVLQIDNDFNVDIKKNNKPKYSHINYEITRIGGTIVFADYLSENNNVPQMSWMLSSNIETLIELNDQPPIIEFFGSVHRNMRASELLIQAIATKCSRSGNLAFRRKVLKCLENVHESQTGKVLSLLLPDFLNTRMISLSRLVATVASRKVEYLLTLDQDQVHKQLSKEQVTKVIDELISLKLVKKHEALMGLLNKLTTQFYDLSPVEFDQRRSIKSEYIKNLNVDDSWFLSQVKSACFETINGIECAELLSKLPPDKMLSVMNNKNFNNKLFKDCIIWSLNNSNDQLMKTCEIVITNKVYGVISLIPKTHQVFFPSDRDPIAAEVKYAHRLSDLLAEESFFILLQEFLPCVAEFIKRKSNFPSCTIPEKSLDDLTRFAVLSLELITYSLEVNVTFNVNFISACLECARAVFNEFNLCNILASDANSSWLCSSINSVYKLITFLLMDSEPLPSLPMSNLEKSQENIETLPAGRAVHQIYILVCWLERVTKNDIIVTFPQYLFQSLKSIIVSLARMPLVNSYVLTPPAAWKSGWSTECSGPFLTQVSPLPLDYLQEVDILEEFIFRITLLSWKSRLQFEENWVSLLSALSTTPNEEYSSEDKNIITHSNCLAIQALTTLLQQTLHFPFSYQNDSVFFLHVPRDAAIDVDSPHLKKLKLLQTKFSEKLKQNSHFLNNYHSLVNVFDKPNLESFGNVYSYSQLSLEYLLIATKSLNDFNAHNLAAMMYKKRESFLNGLGLDVNSCIQFMLDLFNQWIESDAPVHLRLLYQIAKSIVSISDLFSEKAHFQWMLDTCLMLSKTHSVEDEIIHQYLVLAVCKAAAVLQPDLETLEYIKKLLSQSLKNPFLPTRIASLHGLLYILQMCFLKNGEEENTSEETKSFLPLAIDYVQFHISSNNSVLQYSQEHCLLVWSLAFYLLENADVEETLAETVFQAALNVLSETSLNQCTFFPLIKGLERLMITKRVPKSICRKVINYSLTEFKRNIPLISITAGQLLFTSLYMEHSEHLNSTSSVKVSNPDHLVQSIEKISAIFDKIKKGLPFEVDIFSSILSDFLTDFFSPSDILTKVISEFLSPQQRHPMQLSRIVFKVFESAIKEEQLSLLQDWVVFNLSNFTHSASVGMATWCLTCFFISASTNSHIRNMFAYVQKRMGRYEYEDRKFLCIAGSDFYKNLKNEPQRKTFLETLASAKDQADMPFNELLMCL